MEALDFPSTKWIQNWLLEFGYRGNAKYTKIFPTKKKQSLLSTYSDPIGNSLKKLGQRRLIEFVYSMFVKKLALNVNLIVIAFWFSQQSRSVLPIIFRWNWIDRNRSRATVSKCHEPNSWAVSMSRKHNTHGEHSKNTIARIVYHSKFTSRIITVETNLVLLFVYLRTIFIPPTHETGALASVWNTSV